jgi:hypothetical protein
MSEAHQQQFGRATLARSRAALDSASEAYETNARPFIIVLFLISVILPFSFFVGPLRLSPLRVLLIVMFFPLVFRWLSGKYGGIRLPDILLTVLGIWMFIVMSVSSGFVESIEFLGTQISEMLGAYLLARVYIRDKSSFLFFVRCLVFTIAAMIPLALVEALTKTMPMSVLFGSIPGFFVIPYGEYDPRMGLYRAQVGFPHAILFGVFCSTAFALAWFASQARGTNIAVRSIWVSLVFVASFLSLSSGAILSIMLQVLLIGWNWITFSLKKRWLVLGLIVMAMYVTIDLLSNRSPISVFISSATFSSHNAYYRILIWEYGIADVMRNPIFGRGLDPNWVRPSWMGSASVDNFWLLTAMRFGIPGLVFLLLALLSLLISVGRQKLPNRPDLVFCQKGYMISLIALFLSLCTVHIWEGMFVYTFFLIGSGVWLYTSNIDTSAPAGELPDADQDIRGDSIRKSAVKSGVREVITRRSTDPALQSDAAGRSDEPETGTRPQHSPYTRGTLHKR